MRHFDGWLVQILLRFCVNTISHDNCWLCRGTFSPFHVQPQAIVLIWWKLIFCNTPAISYHSIPWYCPLQSLICSLVHFSFFWLSILCREVHLADINNTDKQLFCSGLALFRSLQNVPFFMAFFLIKPFVYVYFF